MIRWKTLTLFSAAIILLCCGFIVGRWHTVRQIYYGTHTDLRYFEGIILRRLQYQLDLNGEQVQVIKPLLEGLSEEMIAIRLAVNPQIQDAMSRTIEKARPHLREEQYQKWNALQKQFGTRLGGLSRTPRDHEGE